MGRVANKVAIVTGGAGGLGSVVVQKLLEEGAFVACFDVIPQDIEIPVEFRTRFREFTVDVADEESVRQGVTVAADTFGDISVLVNCASVLGPSKQPHEVTKFDFEHTFAINVTGTWLCTKYAIPSMLSAGKGSIINVSSVGALVGGSPMSTYHATKGAIRSMSRADAVTYAPHNIRVNSIYPGSIATPMSELAAENSPEGPVAYRKRMNAAHPIGHRGEPDDIAYAVLYLASDESKFVTGAELTIDGGYTAK